MGRLEQLLAASWKGIPFLIRSEMLTEGGRRIVLHDYPNSSERFVEDLGELPPKFSITAFVTGEDFLDRAAQLERALKEPGKGRLSMPTLGVRSLFAMPYRKDASQKEVGEIRFELEFVAGRAISGPVQTPVTTQGVYALGDAARVAVADALGELWIDPVSTPNVVTAQFDLEQFTIAIAAVVAVASNVTDINRISGFITNNSQSIVRSSNTLKTTFISDLWQTVSVGLSGGKGLPLLTELTKFGSRLSLSLSDIRAAVVAESSSMTAAQTETSIPLWPYTTAGRTERNNNRLNLVNSGRVAALVSAYEQAADSSYNTASEIEEARLAVETQHQRLMRDDTYNRNLVQSQVGVRSAVEQVRLSSLTVLDQKEQSSYTLATVSGNAPVSAFVLSYNLYAEEFTTSEMVTSRGVELRGLNPTQPSDKLSSDITVLQA